MLLYFRVFRFFNQKAIFLFFYFFSGEISLTFFIESDVLVKFGSGICEDLGSLTEIGPEATTTAVFAKVDLIRGEVTHQLYLISLTLQLLALKFLDPISLFLIMNIIRRYFLFQNLV